jgi:hypothetical protein
MEQDFETIVAALRTELDALTRMVDSLEARWAHQQNRLSEQGARIRHLEQLPGVAETLDTGRRHATGQ